MLITSYPCWVLMPSYRETQEVPKNSKMRTSSSETGGTVSKSCKVHCMRVLVYQDVT